MGAKVLSKYSYDIDITNLDAVLFSFYWLDIQSIKKYLAQYAQKWNGGFSEDIDIDPLLHLQYAYNPNPQRATFFSVGKNTTIMFPNLQDGWRTLFHNIARGLKAKACNMTIMDDKRMIDPGNYLDYVEDSLARVVYTIKEDKWIFFEQGTPLPFENTAYYTAKQKKERLNKRIMLEYCESLRITKNGVISLAFENAFSFEMFWGGKYANSKGFGSTSLMRK
jgi:hypothetical protein